MPNNGILHTLNPILNEGTLLLAKRHRNRRGSFSETDYHMSESDDDDSQTDISSSDGGHRFGTDISDSNGGLMFGTRAKKESRLVQTLSEKVEGASLMEGIHMRVLVPDESWASDTTYSSDFNSSARHLRLARGPASSRRLQISLNGVWAECPTSGEIKEALQELRKLMAAIRPTPVDIIFRPIGNETNPPISHHASRSGRPASKSGKIVHLSDLLSTKNLETLGAKCGPSLPSQIPMAWAEALGLSKRTAGKEQATAEIKIQAKLLYDVLDICKPSRVSIDLSFSARTDIDGLGGRHLDTSSDDSDSDNAQGSRAREGRRQNQAPEVMENNLDADQILVPMGVIPFVLAGNKYYGSAIPNGKVGRTRQPRLPLLELGPEIPISMESSLKLNGLFAFGRWNPKAMVIHYWSKEPDNVGVEGEHKGVAGRLGKHGMAGGALPELIWRSSFGLGEHILEADEQQQGRSDHSEIILVVDSADQIDALRDDIEFLSGIRPKRSGLFGRSKQGDAGLAQRDSESAARLERCKHGLFYINISDPTGQGILPVWNEDADTSHRSRVKCTCGKRHGGRRPVDRQADRDARHSPNAGRRKDTSEEPSKPSLRRWLGLRKARKASARPGSPAGRESNGQRSSASDDSR